MNEEEMIIRDALELVRASAGTGVDRTKLLNALRTLDGLPLSPEQKAYVFEVLETRGWVTYHLNPVWHSKRWTLTPAGLTALEAM